MIKFSRMRVHEFNFFCMFCNTVFGRPGLFVKADSMYVIFGCIVLVIKGVSVDVLVLICK